jgi:predicted dehydrogenase
MKALVVGYGSIGSRHARLLTSLGCEVAVVSPRDVDAPRLYRNLDEGMAWKPGYIVIANRTGDHHRTLADLAARGFSGTVLVEKPLFHGETELPSHNFERAYVGYNLRFHPIVRKLRTLLERERVLSVQAYAGQYLPGWRPRTDYRLSYSADIKKGGGVLRDLSHELDYLNWLLGGWNRLTALGGHYSKLEINSDDVWTIMMSTGRCPLVTIQLNYLDRLTRRRVLINTDDHTIEADLVNGSIMIDNSIEEIRTERDFTYMEQHRAILEDRRDSLCTLQEGIEVMHLIYAVERSARKKEWVSQ